jgi:hypothetical protein
MKNHELWTPRFGPNTTLSNVGYIKWYQVIYFEIDLGYTLYRRVLKVWYLAKTEMVENFGFSSAPKIWTREPRVTLGKNFVHNFY